jgi:hypothetical protein
VSSAARVLGVTARFFEGVFFTELGDAIAVTRRRGDAIVSGLVLLGPMGSDREQALAEISGFYQFTFQKKYFDILRPLDDNDLVRKTVQQWRIEWVCRRCSYQ